MVPLPPRARNLSPLVHIRTFSASKIPCVAGGVPLKIIFLSSSFSFYLLFFSWIKLKHRQWFMEKVIKGAFGRPLPFKGMSTSKKSEASSLGDIYDPCADDYTVAYLNRQGMILVPSSTITIPKQKKRCANCTTCFPHQP